MRSRGLSGEVITPRSTRSSGDTVASVVGEVVDVNVALAELGDLDDKSAISDFRVVLLCLGLRIPLFTGIDQDGLAKA